MRSFMPILKLNGARARRLPQCASPTFSGVDVDLLHVAFAAIGFVERSRLRCGRAWAFQDAANHRFVARGRRFDASHRLAQV